MGAVQSSAEASEHISMAERLQARYSPLIQAIHSSPTKAVLFVTGGASQVRAAGMQTSGAYVPSGIAARLQSIGCFAGSGVAAVGARGLRHYPGVPGPLRDSLI